MKKSDFYFELPEELIAQTPLERRDSSRLMVLGKGTGEIAHRHFYDLPELLRAGDLLIMNDSRVLPARLFGRVEKSGEGGSAGAACEIVLLRDRSGEHDCGAGQCVWECLVRPGKKLRPGRRVVFGDGELRGEVTEIIEGGNRLLRFEYEGIFLEALERLGKMPLPPYIHEELTDAERYQTVYSREIGSAAAPTAGLHFTNELLDELRGSGVDTAFVTLHVGLGTFRPVKTDDILEHEMHSEFCTVPAETVRKVRETKARGGRVIAVGTTSCRTLESACGSDGVLREFAGFTDIFIYPGYEFRCVDALVTNFHLPESTLIMLVSALAGRENVLAAYAEAVRERYRFFSFGDAMLIG